MLSSNNVFARAFTSCRTSIRITDTENGRRNKTRRLILLLLLLLLLAGTVCAKREIRGSRYE